MNVFFGNLLLPPPSVDAVCVTTNLQIKRNGDAVMGAGIALAANKKWRLATAYGRKLAMGNREVTEILATRRGAERELTIVAFPTKDDWRNKSSIKLIQQGLDQLQLLADRHEWQHVWLPSLGTNNGGLRRTDVWPLMARTLDNRFSLILKKG